MQSLGWKVYELCGGGLAHHITDISKQIKSKRNIFCITNKCEIVSLIPTIEEDMYIVNFDHRGQVKLNFIEFLFNNEKEDCFLYARNHEISLLLSKSILTRDGINYLAPEIVLLYKSTDTEREGYQLDFDTAIKVMSEEQINWLHNALLVMNPNGHKWIEELKKLIYINNPCRTLSIPFWKDKTITLPDNMLISHNDHFSEDLLSSYNDELYFRLYNPLDNIQKPNVPEGFRMLTLKTPLNVEILVENINKSYEDLAVCAQQLIDYLEHYTYDSDLWVAIQEINTNSIIASGIAEFDNEMKEGVLEWIQVLPEYRGKGMGQIIVNELLLRLKQKADFVTVSGKINNKTNPELLYRKCGFLGTDVWHILTRK